MNNRICPACCHWFNKRDLTPLGSCPLCNYDAGPYLPTVAELLSQKGSGSSWNDVDLHRFARELARYFRRNGLPLPSRIRRDAEPSR